MTTAVVAAVGALIYNGVSANAANKQLEVAQQSQIAARYSVAVGQLGSASSEVRLGGIYALERLMRDSPADQPTIVEVLSAFLRDKDSRDANQPSDIPYSPSFPPADIFAAIKVLATRDFRSDATDQVVDLTDVNLGAFPLAYLRLANMNLTGIGLAGADLTGADLSGANLTDADLTGAELYGADLTGADLLRADLDQANVTDAEMTSATGVNLKGAIGNPLSN